MCLDERSVGAAVADAGRALVTGPATRPQGRHAALTPPTGDQIRRAVEASSLRVLADVLRGAERPGWEVLAADVYGLPWAGTKTSATSHGTWGWHKECRTIAKLHPDVMDCPACGPEPVRPPEPAKPDDPYLLYLVTHRKRQKFGVGDRRRIETQLRRGATLVQVLRAPFAQVLLAESALKHQHQHQHQHPRPVPGWQFRDVIGSLRQATEVIRHKVQINLAEVLPEGEDVTHWFR